MAAPVNEEANSDAAPERRSLQHDTVWSILATGTRTVGAVGLFYLLARYLGREDFGRYSALFAAFLILGGFVTMGTSHIVVKRVSVDRSQTARSWGAALLPGLIFSVVVAGALAVLGDLVVPGVQGRDILLLGLAEFLGIAVSVPAAHALQAMDRFPQSSILTMFWTLLRVGFVASAFFVFDAQSLQGVGVALLLASIGAGLTSSAVLASIAGLPKFSISESIQIVREGFPFSLTQASSIILGDIDKQMLVRRPLDGPALNGIYSASNRVLGLVATPVYAVLAATYPRFFAKGAADGLRGTWGYSKRLMLPVAGYAVLASIGLFITAPLVDDILGSDYTDSIRTIRWMSIIPMIHLPALLAGEAVTGAGLQNTRNRFIVLAGALNIALNLALIGPYGIDGVIVATYAAEIFLLGGLVIWIRGQVADVGAPND